MRFPDDFLRRVRERTSIAQYAGRKITFDMRRSQPARGDYWACCPFHGEKSPSFHVLDGPGRYKCFGCHEAGDVFTLAMKLEGVSFPEAVERFAGEAGIAMPAQDQRLDESALARRKRLIALMARAGKLYESYLRGAEGRAARDYLKRRGLDEPIWSQFGLGLSPAGWTDAIDALGREGFTQDELVGAGLASLGDGRRPIDVFRARIMFPIHDASGVLIAFGGRALDPEAKAKYLNSPETELFHKGRNLYRLKEARALAARAKARGLVVCEGYMDVIAFERAGIGAVAPLGTAMTEDQLALCWRAGAEAILCFDGDAAGAKAAERALDKALPQLAPERQVYVLRPPPGEDPDDVFRTRGSEGLQALLAGAQPAVEALFAREKAAANLATPEGRAGFKGRLRQAAARIQDGETRSQYLRTLLSKADDALREPRPQQAQAPRYQPGPGGRRFAPPPQASAELKAQLAAQRDRALEDLLREAIDIAAILDQEHALLAGLPLRDPDLAAIRDGALSLYFSAKGIDREALKRHLAMIGEENAQSRVSRWPAPQAHDASSPPPEDDIPLRVARWRAVVTDYGARPEIDADLAGLRARVDDDDDAFARACALAKARIDVSRADLLTQEPDETPASLQNAPAKKSAA